MVRRLFVVFLTFTLTVVLTAFYLDSHGQFHIRSGETIELNVERPSDAALDAIQIHNNTGAAIEFKMGGPFSEMTVRLPKNCVYSLEFERPREIDDFYIKNTGPHMVIAVFGRFVRK